MVGTDSTRFTWNWCLEWRCRGIWSGGIQFLGPDWLTPMNHENADKISGCTCVHLCICVHVTVIVLMLMLIVTDADQETAWREELVSILSSVPQSVRVVMRYLFAFLNQ